MEISQISRKGAKQPAADAKAQKIHDSFAALRLLRGFA